MMQSPCPGAFKSFAGEQCRKEPWLVPISLLPLYSMQRILPYLRFGILYLILFMRTFDHNEMNTEDCFPEALLKYNFWAYANPTYCCEAQFCLVLCSPFF